MSNDDMVPRYRLNEVIDQRDKARRELATVNEASKGHALELAALQASFDKSEAKLKAGAVKYEALESSHKSSTTARDNHDALRDAGVSSKAHRDYFLMQVPDGVSPLDHFKDLQGRESIEDGILASMITPAEDTQQQRSKTPTRTNGAAPKGKAKTAGEWNGFLATATPQEIKAAAPALREQMPQLAPTLDATLAAFGLSD